MPERTIDNKNKLPVIVNLVVFVHEKQNSRAGVISNDYGQYEVLSAPLSENDSSYEVAQKLLDKHVSLDRLSPFSIRLCACLDKSNRYVGHFERDLSLIFKLDIQENSKISDEIILMTAEDAATAIEENQFIKDHAEIIKTAIYHG